jgi:hypothetical protein
MKKKPKTWNVAFSMSATIQVKASSAEDAEAKVEALSDEDLMYAIILEAENPTP